MNLWNKVLESFGSSYIPIIKFTDILEIIIIILVIYKILKEIKNTRTFVLLKGILLLFSFYLLANFFSFNVIIIIFKSMSILAIFASIVVFQPEIRKFLEKIGTRSIPGNFSIKSLFLKNDYSTKNYSDKTIQNLVEAVFALGEVKTGALIVMEHKIPLNEYIDSGILLNSDISSQLLINIFEKNTPLHDGALVTRGDKIIAGTCYLPLTNNPKISKTMGTRHRAGIGVGEVTDCFVIIVSEESGKVSYVHGDNFKHNITQDELILKLEELQNNEESINIRTIKRKPITYNWKLKLISMIIGIFGWLFILNVTNPLMTITIKDVPIRVSNESVITNLGKTYEIVSGDYVDVVVTGHRSIVDYVKKEDITITADMSKLSYVSSISLQSKSIAYPSLKIKFLENKDTVTVELDNIESKEFPVTVEKQGATQKGYYVHTLTPNNNTLLITGPSKVLQIINKVVLPVEVGTISENNTYIASPQIYDGNGILLDSTNLKFNTKSFTIKAETFKSKEIPVNVELENTANIKDKYNVQILSLTSKSIFISGEDSVLNDISKLDIKIDNKVDLSGSINNQYTKTINIVDYLPKNVYLAQSDDKINIKLEAKPYETKKIIFSNKNLEILNLDPAYKATIQSDNYEVSLMGTKEILSTLKIEDMLPYVDLKDIKEGECNLLVQFGKMSNLKPTSNVTVKIIISKKK